MQLHDVTGRIGSGWPHDVLYVHTNSLGSEAGIAAELDSWMSDWPDAEPLIAFMENENRSGDPEGYTYPWNCFDYTGQQIEASITYWETQFAYARAALGTSTQLAIASAIPVWYPTALYGDGLSDADIALYQRRMAMGNDGLRRTLVPLVDYIAPYLYTKVDDAEKSVAMVDWQMAEARKYRKPIYPLVMPQVNDSDEFPWLSAETWRAILERIRYYCRHALCYVTREPDGDEEWLTWNAGQYGVTS